MTTATTTDALIAALRWASRHVLSERTNDVGQVMATISQTSSAHIAVRDPTGGVSSVFSGIGPDAVTGRQVVLLNRVVGDWYVFSEWAS